MLSCRVRENAPLVQNVGTLALLGWVVWRSSCCFQTPQCSRLAFPPGRRLASRLAVAEKSAPKVLLLRGGFNGFLQVRQHVGEPILPSFPVRLLCHAALLWLHERSSTN